MGVKCNGLGPTNSNWRGGRSLASNGYILLRVGVGHLLADVRGYAYEHRVVAEAKLGRRLRKGEHVHHVDGDKTGRSIGQRRANFGCPVSVEDRKYGVPRIDDLRNVPAAVRFLSIEPLLEDIGDIDLTGIGWVIVGCESGHGARHMSEDWVRSIRDQCLAQGVPFFYKQRLDERGHKVSLPMLDGRHWAEMPHA